MGNEEIERKKEREKERKEMQQKNKVGRTGRNKRFLTKI